MWLTEINYYNLYSITLLVTSVIYPHAFDVSSIIGSCRFAVYVINCLVPVYLYCVTTAY